MLRLAEARHARLSVSATTANLSGSSKLTPAGLGSMGVPVLQVPILGGHSEVWLYLEEAKSDKALVTLTPGKMLLFFKLYDPRQQTLAYLGRCYAHGTNSLPGLMPFLYKKAGLPDSTHLKVCWVLCLLCYQRQFLIQSCVHILYTKHE